MKITIVKGDIAKTKADAIVNEVNTSLEGCGGVDNSIKNEAGIELEREIYKIKKAKYKEGLSEGEAFATGAYKLPAKIIIHTAVPIQKDLVLLEDCYINSLKIAEENNCKTIAFPAISTGLYQVPIQTSAKLVKEIFENYKSDVIEEVILVLYDAFHYDVYKRIFGEK